MRILILPLVTGKILANHLTFLCLTFLTKNWRDSYFSNLFWLDVYFFLLFQIVDLSPGFLYFTVHSLYIFFISLCIAFISSFIVQPHSVISVSILISSVLNFASDRLATSSSLSSFSGVLICFSLGLHFFISAHLLHCKGWSLRCAPGCR